jgi:FkbM family methyltransferase
MIPIPIRDTFFRVRHGFQGVPRQLGEYSIRLDESLRRWDLEAEAIARQVFQTSLQPGDVVLDIGANFGLHTLYAAQRVGVTGHVFAFEPVPSNLSLLRRHVALNQMGDRISVVPTALSNALASQLTFYLAPEQVAVTASLCPPTQEAKTVMVANTRLDDYWQTVNRPVQLIKIDVEGAELEVLRGAQRVLETWHPLLLIEVHGFALPQFGASVEDVRSFLHQLGYTEEELPGEAFHSDYFQAIYRYPSQPVPEARNTEDQ